MAKKKTSKAAPKAKAGNKILSKKAVGKVINKAIKKASKPRIQSPRSVPLPGMEQVTNRTLNRICEHLSDVRREMNRARSEEKDLVNQAVPVMQKDKVTAYRFSGVELVLVPGDVHLRVRTLKETSSAEPAQTTGSGQDAAETLDANTAEPEDTEADEEAAAADLEG